MANFVLIQLVCMQLLREYVNDNDVQIYAVV